MIIVSRKGRSWENGSSKIRVHTWTGSQPGSAVIDSSFNILTNTRRKLPINQSINQYKLLVRYIKVKIFAWVATDSIPGKQSPKLASCLRAVSSRVWAISRYMLKWWATMENLSVSSGCCLRRYSRRATLSLFSWKKKNDLNVICHQRSTKVSDVT